jgi:hypothetical protein
MKIFASNQNDWKINTLYYMYTTDETTAKSLKLDGQTPLIYISTMIFCPNRDPKNIKWREAANKDLRRLVSLIWQTRTITFDESKIE